VPRLPSAPGWYPDGLHPDEIRYWDGHDWTSQWRPRPTWAPSETQIIRLLPETARTQPRRARTRVAPALFTAVLAAALLGSAVLAGRQGAGLGEDGIAVPIISDPSFVAAANRICQAVLGPSRPSAQASSARSAAVISRPGQGQPPAAAARANRLALLERRLGALQVDPGDRAAVQQWLSDWGVAASSAAREARALRTGSNPGSARSQLSRAVASLDDFAETNAISRCAV
jgi:hypothetical protein